MRHFIRIRPVLAMTAFQVLFLAGPAQPQELFPDIGGNSKPADGTPGVTRDKGKRGLLYHFNCIDAGNNPVNSCFPLGHYDATGKFVSLGSSAVVTLSSAANPCTFGSSPAAGACSYIVLDAFGHGNFCDSPIPGDPNPNSFPCIDTVEIFFNGELAGGTTVGESVTKAAGHSFDASAGVTQDACPAPAACNLSFTTSTATGAAPVSLELVFDISGSMACSTTSTNCPAGVGEIQRIAALQSSSKVFFDTLNAFAIPGDKLGVSFFSTKAKPDPTGSPVCNSTNLVMANVPANVSTVESNVLAQTPTDSTSIGAGLVSADSCGFALDTAPNTNKEVLLFSDGEQNTAPKVRVQVPSQVQVSDAAGTTFTNYPSDIRICPVTAGRLTAVGFGLQQQIANAACSGLNAHIRDDSQNLVGNDLDTFFAQALSSVLPTDKLELVDDATGVLAQGGAAVEKYLGNGNDVRTTIAISWTGGRQNDFPTFQLRSPDGQLVDVTGKTTSSLDHMYVNLPLPLFRNGLPVVQKGLWQIELAGAKIFSKQLAYHVLVMSDNPTIATAFQVAIKDVGTGDPIPIKVTLTDRGVPVLNAIVQAQLIGPQNSLGSILATTTATLGPNTGPDPASTKGQAKLDALLANPATATLFADQSLPTLTLSDDGNASHGDANANDGIYTGLFADTSKEGHYYFAIRVLGTSKAGDYQRTFRLTEFVRSMADTGQTTWQVLSSIPQTNGTRFVTLTTTPHDKLGNYVGPGYEKDLQITSSQGVVQTPLNDNLDGSYQITYSLPSLTSNPTIGVVILGVPVKQGPLSSIPGGTLVSSGGKWDVSFHIGGTVAPTGLLSGFSPSVSVGGNLEYRLPLGFSVETYLGYDRFSKSGASLRFVNLSERIKYSYGSAAVRPFVFVGGGYFASGGNNYGGLSLGGGVQYWVNPKHGIDLTYTFHDVFVNGIALFPVSGKAEYSTLTIGYRRVF